ncbi:MAG: hypothetical protein ABIQ64_04795 [Candidatus Saccharimonadales bacterium]
MHNPERNNGPEVAIDVSEAAASQSEKLRKAESSLEKSPEKSGEALVADARKETEAAFAKESGKERRSGGEPSATPAAIRKITKREKDRVYKQTLTRVQSEMNAPARAFSKIIHAPIVEKTSEVVGSTAARPNALLMGSMMALVLLSIVYAVGQTYGYRLSGFEMIAAYTTGWVVGLLADYVKIMASGRA